MRLHLAAVAFALVFVGVAQAGTKFKPSDAHENVKGITVGKSNKVIATKEQADKAEDIDKLKNWKSDKDKDVAAIDADKVVTDKSYYDYSYSYSYSRYSSYGYTGYYYPYNSYYSYSYHSYSTYTANYSSYGGYSSYYSSYSSYTSASYTFSYRPAYYYVYTSYPGYYQRYS